MPARFIAFQLHDGTIVGTDAYRRLWPAGRVPSPRQREMLGIRPLTENEITWTWDPARGCVTMSLKHDRS